MEKKRETVGVLGNPSTREVGERVTLPPDVVNTLQKEIKSSQTLKSCDIKNMLFGYLILRKCTQRGSLV